jgi:2-amino-4-hydroxy-6-hydroxymethyldihydropteridine diphosphokinase
MIFDSTHTTAYVSLGSNLGDRAGNHLLAVRGLMEASFEIEKMSAVYETEPVDMEESPDFLNIVVELKCESITPSQMMARMLRIEYLLGRKDKNLRKPRTIDLDLLFFGHHKIKTPFLTLPHPRLHLRNFVLIPMVEIAPRHVHPVFRKNMARLLNESTDTSLVNRWFPTGSAELEGAESG